MELRDCDARRARIFPLAQLTLCLPAQANDNRMKIVRLIRHGQSTANTGAATQNHASIPLTDKGIQQAQQVAHSFTHAPELIAVSAFSRAQQTAGATAAVFPSTPFETWLVQEFTYLNPIRCVNTTVTQRRAWVEAYWNRAEPCYSDGDGAESFSDFIARAQSCLDRLAAHPAQHIAVFSHGQFLNAVAWLLECKPQNIDGQAMADWRAYEIENTFENAWGYLLFREQGAMAWELGQRVAPGGELQQHRATETERPGMLQQRWK